MAQYKTNNLFVFMVMAFEVVFGGLNDDYGEYHVRIANVTQCPVTTPDDVVVNMTWNKIDDVDKFFIYVELKKAVGPIGFRLRVSRQEQSMRIFRSLVNFRFNNVCEQPMGKELIKIIPNLNDDCTVRMGKFEFAIVNLNEFIHSASNARSFFYGNYLSHMEINLKQLGKCLCVKLFSVFSPQ